MTPPVAVAVLASRGGGRLERALASVAWASERLVLDPARRLGDEALPAGVTRAADPSAAAAPWVLLLGAGEVVPEALAAEIAKTVDAADAAAAYRIGQDAEAFGATLRLPGAPVRLARRAGATLDARGGRLALGPRAGRVGRLRCRLSARSAASLGAAMEELDADADALAAVLHAGGSRPRITHLAAVPLLPAARSLVARRRGGERWARWKLAAFDGYRIAVVYAKLWELRRAEGSLAS